MMYSPEPSGLQNQITNQNKRQTKVNNEMNKE